jgi:ribonuclease HI
MNHPHASLQNVLTFMWCIWKSRNDCLFDRKKGEPYQINLNAQAIHNNLEPGNFTEPHLQVQPNVQVIASDSLPVPGNTIKSDLAITGTKLYTDVAWKKKRSPGLARVVTGLGIFCQFQEEQSSTKIFIQASTTTASSSLQAEACALLVGAKVASLLQLKQVTLLTDNLCLAKAAATTTTSDPQVLWEIRYLIAEYKQASKALSPKIYHISRNLNGVAHSCAQQAIRQSMSEPIFSCTNLAHATMPCPTAILLQNSVFQGTVIHAVICS